MRRRWLLTTVGVCLLGGTSTLVLVGRGPAIRIAGSRVGVTLPRAGEHLVLVVHGAQDTGDAPDVSHVVDELRGRGLGLVELPPDDVEPTVRTAVEALRREESTALAKYALLAVGHGAQGVWEVVADPPAGLVACVTIGVPGVAGLDFAAGGAVASLSLNLAADTAATSSHHLVHEPMATAGVVHQVIEYGRTGPGALDADDPGFDAATARDVDLRAADWLQHRDGFSHQNIENPHGH